MNDEPDQTENICEMLCWPWNISVEILVAWRNANMLSLIVSWNSKDVFLI